MKEFFTTCNPFLFLGIIWFLFFGFGAERIFGNSKFLARDGSGKLIKSIPAKIAQVLLDGVGTLVGWFTLYLIWEVPVVEFSFQHILFLLVAFAGITGMLPRIVYHGLWGK